SARRLRRARRRGRRERKLEANAAAQWKTRRSWSWRSLKVWAICPEKQNVPPFRGGTWRSLYAHRENCQRAAGTGRPSRGRGKADYDAYITEGVDERRGLLRVSHCVL